MFNATAKALNWFVLLERVSVIASFDNNPIYNQFSAGSRLRGVRVKSCHWSKKINKFKLKRRGIFSVKENQHNPGFVVFITWALQEAHRPCCVFHTQEGQQPWHT